MYSSLNLLQYIIPQQQKRASMDRFTTPSDPNKLRSMSYNDLKRNRLARSERSKSKLLSNNKNSGTATQAKNTRRQYSEVKSILSTIPQDQIVLQTCINQLKGKLCKLRDKVHSSKPNHFQLKQSKNNANVTDRYQKYKIELKVNTINNKNDLYRSIEDGGSKQLIKSLIIRNKSKRRLLKVSDIRDKLKQQKSRSRSKSRLDKSQTKLAILQKSLRKEDQFEPKIERSAKKSFRANKFETIDEKTAHKSISKAATEHQKENEIDQISKTISARHSSNRNRMSHSKSIKIIEIPTMKEDKCTVQFKEVEYCSELSQRLLADLEKKKQSRIIEHKVHQIEFHKKQKQIIVQNELIHQNIQKQQVNQTLCELQKSILKQGQISVIRHQKESQFVNDSVENVMQCLNQDQNSNVLDLLNIPTMELKNLPKAKEKRVKLQMQKYRKIFPKDFFQN